MPRHHGLRETATNREMKAAYHRLLRGGGRRLTSADGDSGGEESEKADNALAAPLLSQARPDALAHLVAEFCARRAAGENVSMRQFCGQHKLPQKQFENRLRAAEGETGVTAMGTPQTLVRPPSAEQRAALAYYARPDIGQALWLWSQNRRTTEHFRQGVIGKGIRRPEDVPLLAAGRGANAASPTFHASVGRYEGERLVAFDLVAEVDFKGDWRRCFSVTRPLVCVLADAGATFLVKFSGHSSAHVILPCHGQNYAHAAQRFLSLARTALRRGAGKLDLSFRRPSHFLRMPYALNENTGLVSLPIAPADYDAFHPDQARLENVGPADLELLHALRVADNSAWLKGR